MKKAFLALLRSFRCAGNGIFRTVRTQRNMRIHLVAAAAALLLSFYYELTKGEYLVLILTIVSVLAAELFNTAIELLADGQTTAFDPRIRDLKDAAAGAVLCCAIGAVAVGVLLFGDMARLRALLVLLFGSPVSVAVTLLICLAAAIFVIWQPKEKNDTKR